MLDASSGSAFGASLALLTAVTYGVSDFAGGVAARTNPVLRVVVVAKVLATTMLLLGVLAEGAPGLTRSDTLWSCAAGLGECVGGLALFRGLAIGPMSVVAPVTSVIGAGLPVLVATIWGGESLSELEIAGLVVAASGIVALAQQGGGDSARGGLPYAVLGGAGFAAAFACLAQLANRAVCLPVAIGQLAALVPLALASIVLRTGIRPRAMRWIAVAAAGEAVGLAAYLAASHAGRVSVAAVLASLYPAATVLMALAVLRERPRRLQWLGLGAIAAATILIAAA